MSTVKVAAFPRTLDGYGSFRAAIGLAVGLLNDKLHIGAARRP